MHTLEENVRAGNQRKTNDTPVLAIKVDKGIYKIYISIGANRGDLSTLSKLDQRICFFVI